jgi:predicted unusual protein kinase regulating ubiquinone biosynthesis (AarF/ABC1/UbiB family)
VLATNYIEGHKIDSAAVQNLPLERRNRLGLSCLNLYLLEFFKLRLVQTDPHLGNYRVQIDPQGQDRLVLFDFGAVREVGEPFWSNYRFLVRAGLNDDARETEKGGRQLGLLQPDDPISLVQEYVELCRLLMEPFAPGQDYDWGASDLPKRVATKVSGIAFNYKMRAPPREQVFLDRKLGGVFIFLSVLKCKMSTRNVVMAAVDVNSDN